MSRVPRSSVSDSATEPKPPAASRRGRSVESYVTEAWRVLVLIHGVAVALQHQTDTVEVIAEALDVIAYDAASKLRELCEVMPGSVANWRVGDEGSRTEGGAR